MTAKIDISPEQLAIVQGVLKAHLPKGTLAWAFGSRVTWTAKPFSDLDIALEGAAPLAPDVLIDLEEAFEASDLPWKVDVIDLNAVSPEFRAIVERRRVPADWEEVTLSDVSDPSRKITYGIVQPGQLHSEGVPIVRVNNFRGNSLDLTERLAVSPEIEAKYRRSRPRPSDLLISLVGSIGQLAIAPPEIEGWNLARAVGLVPFANQAVANWSFYSLQSTASQDFMNQRANTTVQTAFYLKDLAKIPIQLPPEWEMDGILTTLQALDDKIELNRRMNETLEAMARAVFRDWFVDFGPTRRKAAGETDPAAILGGLLPAPTRDMPAEVGTGSASGISTKPLQAPPLAALFPDSFGKNGLPEGWEEKPLDEIAEFLNGLALQKFPAKAGEDSLPVIKIAELRGGVTAKSNRASRDLPQKYVINDGNFIFSWSGSLMAKFWTEGEGALNQHLFKVSSEAYPAWFYSQWVYHHLDEFQRIAASKATTMGHIQRGHLKAAMTVDPGEAMLSAMGGIMGPLLELAIHNDLENQTLAATRDLLLPKLMSGEIRLTGTEGVA